MNFRAAVAKFVRKVKLAEIHVLLEVRPVIREGVVHAMVKYLICDSSVVRSNARSRAKTVEMYH